MLKIFGTPSLVLVGLQNSSIGAWAHCQIFKKNKVGKEQHIRKSYFKNFFHRFLKFPNSGPAKVLE